MSDPLAGLPAVPDAAMPADVRTADSATKTEYRTAMGFEQIMLGQLVKAMVPADSELASGPYADQMQTALTGSLVADGGVGLGAQLFSIMRETGR